MPTTPAAAAGTAPHHWQQGPADVHPVKPFTNGGRRYAWKFYWCLDKVVGTSRSAALRGIYSVINAPQGWARAGVRWVRTMDPAKADILVRVIPQDTSVCGPGSAGCYSWGSSGKPVAEIGVESLGNPFELRVVLGMELCGHGTFRMADGYLKVHQPYVGVLGTWDQARAVDGYPTDEEIAGAQQWLKGQTPPELIHEDDSSAERVGTDAP